MIKTKKTKETINVDLERDKKFLVDLDRTPTIGFSSKVTSVLGKKTRKK